MALKPFFVVPEPFSAVGATSEAAHRPASHLGEFNYRGMVWETTGGGGTVTATLEDAADVDFVAMLGANAQPGTTIRVQAGGHDSGVLPFISPAVSRRDGTYHSHHELPAPVNTGSVQVTIAGHTGPFQASMLVVGKRIQPTRYYEPKWDREVRDLGAVTFGRNGVPGIMPGVRLRSTAYSLAWVTEDEMEELFSPLDERVGKTEPVYLCFDPEATEHRQRRTFFGFNEEQAKWTKQGYNRFSRDFSILSLF